MAAPATVSRTIDDNDFSVTRLLNATFTDTQETAATKFDASTFKNAGQAPNMLAIKKLSWSITGSGAISILFDATSDVSALTLTGEGKLDLSSAPISNNAGAGVTGDILFTTSGFTSGTGYSVLIECQKAGGYTTAPLMTTLAMADGLSGVYVTDDVLEVIATFNQPVFVDPRTAKMTAELDSGNIDIPYASGDGTTQVTFAYKIQAEDHAEATEFHFTHISGIRGSNIASLPVVDVLATLSTATFTVNAEGE